MRDRAAGPETAADRERLIAALERDLRARPEIALAFLHGSFLGGGAYGDIDVAIWLDPARIRREDRDDYALDLAVALHLALGKPVDVRALNEASLAFRYHALKGRPLMVHDEELLAELRARTWDEYFDFQPFARAYLREVLRG
jgi:hypothetical protein